MPVRSDTAQQALDALAARLREIRKDAELTARQVAQAAGWHESKCSRIEHARSIPSPADVRAWCEICGVPDQAADLTAALRTIESMYVEWRRMVRSGMRRLQEAPLPLYERTRLFRIYEPGVIPGLFQTAEYARARMGRIVEFSGIPNDLNAAVWYSGGKLAADLAWPKLRQRWTQPGTAPSGGQLTAAEQKAAWEHAAQVAADAAAQIRAQAGADPAAAADAAWAASDTLHVAAAALGSPVLRQAADALDRAARAPYGHIPAPSPAGNQLRHAARLIGAIAYLTRDPALTPLILITRLAALAEAVAELRHAQQHAAQAAAAQHLHAATGTARGAPPPADPRTRTAARLAGESFPQPFRFVPRKPPHGQPGPGPGSWPGRGPSPPRPPLTR